MTNALTKTITLGAMTGVRTMAGPVAAAGLHPHGQLARARIAIDLLALLESLADKALPLPPRSSPLPLLGRAATGAALGYFLNKQSRPMFALLGAAAAASSAILAVAVRRFVTRRGVPDFVMGLVEDAALAGAGLTLLRVSRT
jgi:hypothetical protein